MILRLLWIGILCVAPLQITHAKKLLITEIHNPEFVEVQVVEQGTWTVAADLENLTLPIVAMPDKNEPRLLVVRVHNQAYKIARADVSLKNEELVVDACATVPVTLVADARSASVKGAGEGCE